MKKRAHIPHNYEISFEIRQDESHACGDGELRGVKSRAMCLIKRPILR